MRHRKSGRSLSRNWEHRKAMFRNMARSLVTHEKIKTTLPKAKELSKVADRLVTLALRGDLSAKRQAYKVLGDHKLVKRLFDDIAPRFEKHQGGYTRVVKYAMPRVGDSASLAMIEFTYATVTEPQAKKPEPQKSSAAKTAPAAAPVHDAPDSAEGKEDLEPGEVTAPDKEARVLDSEDPGRVEDAADETLQKDEPDESRPDEPDDEQGRTK
ncbi:50S ribosomal protein L17 [Desulfonatronospira sp.]|uniref:50S ribosomal protein L17 n=1 Tax=Desulfonatronospira sp. TaxID=1962951 RepID=UPI0025C35C40|nr:50S ribosomal protein L17 [Desulfonatronospira sp.]